MTCSLLQWNFEVNATGLEPITIYFVNEDSTVLKFIFLTKQLTMMQHYICLPTPCGSPPSISPHTILSSPRKRLYFWTIVVTIVGLFQKFVHTIAHMRWAKQMSKNSIIKYHTSRIKKTHQIRLKSSNIK